MGPSLTRTSTTEASVTVRPGNANERNKSNSRGDAPRNRPCGGQPSRQSRSSRNHGRRRPAGPQRNQQSWDLDRLGCTVYKQNHVVSNAQLLLVSPNPESVWLIRTE